MDPSQIRYDPSKKGISQGVTDFELSSNFLEQLLEAHDLGGIEEAEKLLSLHVDSLLKQKCAQVITEVLLFIIDSKSARYRADVLAIASGLRLRDGWVPATLAKKYGVSRTTACKDVEAACELFNLPKEIALRGRCQENVLSNQRNYAKKI